jgi:hypothetical protein
LNAPLPLLLLPAADAARQHRVDGLPLQLPLEVSLRQLLVAVLRCVAFVLYISKFRCSRLLAEGSQQQECKYSLHHITV